MNNLRKTTVNMSEEEISRLKEIDWDSYYKERVDRDSGQIQTCPKCKVMIFPQPGQAEFVCKRCGETISLSQPHA